MIHLQISETTPIPASLDLEAGGFLEEAAQAVLQAEEAPPNSDLAIVISDDAELQALNRQYLDIDAPTDVLSFPSHETDPDSGSLYLGDIIISLPRAETQAASRGHDVRDELQLLVVHGVLHLLGHDHAEEDEKARMWAVQTRVLQSLGSKASSPVD